MADTVCNLLSILKRVPIETGKFQALMQNIKFII